MSNTIAHRPHVQHHVPVMPVLAVVIAIAIAACAAVPGMLSAPTTPFAAGSAAAAARTSLQPPPRPVVRVSIPMCLGKRGSDSTW